MKIPVILLTCLMVITLNGMEDVQQQLDKNKLVQSIGERMYKIQISNVVYCNRHGSLNFNGMAQDNEGLSQDLSLLHKQGVFSGDAKQSVMTEFCNKWGLKEINVKYTESDFKAN